MENLSHSSPDLEEVKVEFQAWRSQQTIGRRIIPQLLWHKAIALLKTYPLTLVVRELGLSRDRLLLFLLHQFQLPTLNPLFLKFLLLTLIILLLLIIQTQTQTQTQTQVQAQVQTQTQTQTQAQAQAQVQAQAQAQAQTQVQV